MDVRRKYKVAKGLVDGRVVRDDIPNTGSIEASLENYEVLPGIREVPFSAFDKMGKLSYYSVSEERRTKDLADQIRESGEIAPLIVVEDAEGPYILEGGHRFDALRELGAKSFPALVVLDLDSVRLEGGPDMPTAPEFPSTTNPREWWDQMAEVYRQLGNDRFIEWAERKVRPQPQWERAVKMMAWNDRNSEFNLDRDILEHRRNREGDPWTEGDVAVALASMLEGEVPEGLGALDPASPEWDAEYTRGWNDGVKMLQKDPEKAFDWWRKNEITIESTPYESGKSDVISEAWVARGIR